MSVTAVKFIHIDLKAGEQPVFPNDGFHYINVDLNGIGNIPSPPYPKYRYPLFLGYQTDGAGEPFTDVMVRAFDKEQTQPIHGWHWTGDNLNKESGSPKYIYFYWKTNGPNPPNPIVSLDVQSMLYKDAYQIIPQNVNEGTVEGNYVYIFAQASGI